MDYALVKELKDAGFTLNEKRKLLGKYDKAYAPNSPDGMLNADYELVPTLEELIEAIPPFVFQLSRDGNRTWRANGKEGSTPTEAVARFWLELNKS
jgi:hypothetical protein